MSDDEQSPRERERERVEESADSDEASDPGEIDGGGANGTGESAEAVDADPVEGGNDGPVDESSTEGPDGDLVERVESAAPEQLAREIDALRSRTDELEAELDERDARIEELESKLKRAQADFRNYKKRQERRREQERRRATEDLVVRLVDVRDNLRRGLEQEGDIREGVESTLRLFDDVLESEDVTEIAPEPGESVDPQRHEVLMRVDSDRPEGTVDDLYQPGYEMAEKVIKPAQVTVSDGNDE
ncbi:nucleotide exchange factor GrpE [Halomarina pelagica]|uniref:nucleotide exchange factor GrpE n=1 Tax=Halomarina pelagica TaxID=2961599 RepID=UPI0020C20CA1|nr:nucleotide exchange factor GrpE [Halomarina sp. BND7]